MLFPTSTPTEKQTEKALGCVVTKLESGYRVWNPETDSTHVVDGECDCTGFQFRRYCYHLTAVELYENSTSSSSSTSHSVLLA